METVTETRAGLVVDGVVKSYAGTTVLHGVSVTVAPGEVIGLVGHNGAGKSTLMKSISGATRPDAGRISVDGQDVRQGEPTAAIAAGIATVYQELSLLPNLTVQQNAFLGREERRGGFMSSAAMHRTTQALIDEFDLGVRPDDLVGQIPVATRQLLEVAIATQRDARYLLLDEPTTALEGSQVDRFLDTVRTLAERGFGIVLVDHKLEELYAVCSRIVALVDGEVRIDAKVAEVSRQEVVHAITGDDVSEEAQAEPRSALPTDARVTVSTRDLVTPALSGVTMQARAGRILGIYGLVGAGRTELLRAIMGIDRMVDGSMEVDARPHRPSGPAVAMRRGIAYVTEERKRDGIVPQLDSSLNLMLPVLRTVRRAGLLDHGRLRRRASELMDALRVRGDRTGPVERLSGGNQQKVVLARALAQEPSVLLLDEPTKGVDLGVKAEIHRLVQRLAHDDGLTVILVSSEEEEIVDVADDVIVMSGGRTDGALVPIEERTPRALRRIAWDAA